MCIIKSGRHDEVIDLLRAYDCQYYGPESFGENESMRLVCISWRGKPPDDFTSKLAPLLVDDTIAEIVFHSRDGSKWRMDVHSSGITSFSTIQQ